MRKIGNYFLLFVLAVTAQMADASSPNDDRQLNASQGPYAAQDPFESDDKGSGHYRIRPLLNASRYHSVKNDEESATRFDNVLSNSRCEGSGAGDCVLMLFLWSDLAPADPRLIHHLQALDVEIKTDAPMSKPFITGTSWNSYDETILTEGMRKAAFLRAKLASVLGAPQSSWPPDSLANTFHQMMTWRRNYRDIFEKLILWRYYDDGSGRSELNPWLLLPENVSGNPNLQAAIIAEVSDIDDDENCGIYTQWVQDFSADFRALLTEQVIKKMGKARRCAQRVH